MSIEAINYGELNPYLHNPRGSDEELQISEGRTYELKDRSGWHFGAGDPEFWKYQDVMLKAGGRLLDVGTQTGRAAMYFALHGMHITGYETDPEWVEHVRILADSGLPELQWDIHQQDFLEAIVEPESYDTILFAQTFLHTPDKAMALEMIDKAWHALKPGGAIWVRACGKMDSTYWELLYAINDWRYPEVTRLNDDVIEYPCACSGAERLEPALFFEQMDLLYYFAVQKNARIVHNRMIPEEEHHNIMFGEDFNRNQPNAYQSGIVTILAQKPLES